MNQPAKSASVESLLEHDGVRATIIDPVLFDRLPGNYVVALQTQGEASPSGDDAYIPGARCVHLLEMLHKYHVII